MRKQALSILAAVLSTACGPQAPDEATPGQPGPDHARLDALAHELKSMSLDQAMASTRFRPLCDQNGFPLVGNVVSKVDLTDVSAYRAEVRKRK